jgi:hypothetical protein
MTSAFFGESPQESIITFSIKNSVFRTILLPQEVDIMHTVMCIRYKTKFRVYI